MASQEYAIASLLFGPSAVVFYWIHAIKMAACAVLLLVCLSMIWADTWAVFALWMAVFFSIGFAHSSIVLQAGELNELLFTLIFIISVLARERYASPAPRKSGIIALIGYVALAVTCLYKESAFVMLLAFSVAEIIRYRFADRGAIPKYIFLLLATAIAYIVFYAFWHGFNLKGSYANTHGVDRWAAMRDYAANDIILVFVMLPTAILRSVMIAYRPSRHTVYDSFLVTACAYCASFVALGIYSVYYLLPAYGFAVCGIAGLLWQIRWRRVRMAITLILAALAAQNSTAAVADVLYNEGVSRNYANFVDFISQWIWLHPNPNGGERNLVIKGVSAGNAVEIMFSLEYNLNYKGLSKSAFNIIPSDPTDNATLSASIAYKSTEGRTPEIGDLVIYNPYQNNPSRPPALVPSSEQIFKSTSNFSMPRWTLWKWIKNCAFTGGHCKDKILAYNLYTGYAAELITRSPEAKAETSLVLSPSYRIGPLTIPERMGGGASRKVNVLVMNTGMEKWPVDTQLGRTGSVYMSYVWLNERNVPILTGERTSFPEVVGPGDSVAVPMNITVPVVKGTYTLVISPVQENVKWFYSEPHDNQGASKRIEVYSPLL